MAVGSTSQRADEVFRTGPETLVLESPAIVVGRVSAYSKHIEAMSEPGENGVPLKWTVTGQIDQLQVLKGKTQLTSIPFTKSEQSRRLSLPADATYWEGGYGGLVSGSQAVVFLSGDRPVKILPSGAGDEDLAALVREVVRVSSIRDPVRKREDWIALFYGQSENLSESALRSLVHMGVPWPHLAPALEQLAQRGDAAVGVRAFAFGLVSYSLRHGAWPADRIKVTDFLCHLFTTEQDPFLGLQYILHLKLLLVWTAEEPPQPDRLALQKKILQCIDTRPPNDPQIEEQYRQIRAMGLK